MKSDYLCYTLYFEGTPLSSIIWHHFNQEFETFLKKRNLYFSQKGWCHMILESVSRQKYHELRNLRLLSSHFIDLSHYVTIDWRLPRL